MASPSQQICPLTRHPCARCDDAACKAQQRTAQLLRLIGSDHEPEAISAAQALRRFCASVGISCNDIGNRFEDMKYSDADAGHIHAHGVEQGRAEQARVQNNGRTLSSDYFDDNGTPRWGDIVKLAESNLSDLTAKEQDFIAHMPSNLRHWRQPTPGQGGFLLSIFWKIRRSLR